MIFGMKNGTISSTANSTRPRKRSRVRASAASAPNVVEMSAVGMAIISVLRKPPSRRPSLIACWYHSKVSR